ncbi:MAG: hypothetical protein SZ59_C0002G0156 [candidate division TM6 bacterium GW2011_GWF2_28_16]|nr:MAG: hypothetical protein SZ59_C0002G0156 [candidate division TM6 bacterium GW2011_GWF2_28_16]
MKKLLLASLLLLFIGTTCSAITVKVVNNTRANWSIVPVENYIMLTKSRASIPARSEIVIRNLPAKHSLQMTARSVGVKTSLSSGGVITLKKDIDAFDDTVTVFINECASNQENCPPTRSVSFESEEERQSFEASYQPGASGVTYYVE